LRIRAVETEDCRLLWEWANDRSVRASAFNGKAIIWRNHIDWFFNKIQDSNCYQYIGMNDDGRPVGQVRFDIAGEIAELDFSVSMNDRGKGYGHQLLLESIKRFYKDTGFPYKLLGRVKRMNSGSRKIFTQLGFLEKKDVSECGEIVIYGPMVLDAFFDIEKSD